MSPLKGPFVGVSAVVVRDGAVLLGRRLGAHGAGTWSFPGGKMSAGEEPAQTVARELAEETGLVAVEVRPLLWTSDVFADDGLHYITLHHLVVAEGEPRVLEPDKAAEWVWWSTRTPWPAPMFGPAARLLDRWTGFP
ncbi:nucleotide triphosphate diphosphatase NUDT15 [Kineosporia succinea]|uniref:8-oxo-dGTP diphosphatase n=1 Tax=Kineosporia succinea TaxID=84632 RepID=A0ABT9P8K8_9ACTN|nr:NUDIX domain-containing protein [Kineosporia succinea]MDP9828797.1 8-oxo-dGTP diphosphatase [Kineosporia succinea]